MVSVAIWVLIASAFLLDLTTPPENVSVCFAYVIPIFVSLFEARSRPMLYAGVATALSLAEPFIQPPNDMSLVVDMGNRLVAVLTQWLAATLVRLQRRRLVDAQDKAEFQQRFVDILSHEIGTTLTTVTGQAYRLTKLSDKLAPNDVVVRAEKIRKAADGIQAIMSRIQFALSLGDGSIPIGQGSINLHTMIQELTEQLKEEQRTETIELGPCANPPFVHGDEMLLRHVFANVIGNSIKYSPSNAPITISITEIGSAVRVTVGDQGSGISQIDLPRVCVPYYRGESSKGTRGTGLGLYVVERIVQAHRGRLLIESEVDHGTKVTIELPQTSALAVT
jgi:signal transduction histidine kinase